MAKVSGKHVMPFVEGLVETLEQFDICGLKRDQLQLKKNLFLDHEINMIIGLTDAIEGNIGFSMSRETSLAIVSAMMGGEEVQDLDDLSMSALSELTNMMAAAATTHLSSLDIVVDITPPTLIMGESMIMIISQVQTVSMNINSHIGVIQINIGLERVLE